MILLDDFYALAYISA